MAGGIAERDRPTMESECEEAVNPGLRADRSKPCSDPWPHELERVPPFVPQETGNAPEHAQGLDGASRFRLAHVCRFPPELIEDPAHDLLRRFVIAADEHRRPAARELRIHHARVSDGIECLDEVGRFELFL